MKSGGREQEWKHETESGAHENSPVGAEILEPSPRVIAVDGGTYRTSPRAPPNLGVCTTGNSQRL